MKENITKFSVVWGKISFDGTELKDIVFVEGRVHQRNYQLLEKKYGTTHIVDADEARELLKGAPWEVIVGNGFESVLKLTPDAEVLLKQRSALIVLPTDQAVARLNDAIKRGVKVSALIHVTC
ncbi:MAG: hypothetical protein NTY48_06865 [Candidatus Diapherotrites archaeon]|nr:hypothetical protein [Candidatus Diapherotrites archaeon]